MLLPDWEIRKLCLEQGMVVPYQEELLNPASLDVTIGSTLLVEVPATPELQPVHIDEYTKEDPLYIAPGQFFLAETVEMFFLPAHIGAQFVLKSSRAREGWDHAEAGWCDPGWHGSRLTMELRNSLSYHPLPVWPGMKIGQMKFCLMHSEPERTYAVRGRYNDNACVTASKG